MSHARNQVVDAIVSLLTSNLTLATRVFAQRIPTSRTVPTYVMVYFESETSEKITLHQASMYHCFAQIGVQAVMRIADYEDLEGAIGDLAVEVQTTLTNDALRAVAPSVKDLSLSQTSVSIDEEQQAFAIMSQMWQVQYMINEGIPQTGI